jgi:hypothetical protein
MIDILQAINDPNLFGSLFKDPASWQNWRVFLAAVFGLPMGDEDKAIFHVFTGRTEPPTAQVREVFAIVGRRGGKSFVSAVVACFLALFRDWSPYLQRGEVGTIMVIASDRQQARVILRYIKGILQIPIFQKEVERDLAWEIILKNQVSIAIKTCDYRTLRGFTVLAAICDELSFWASEGQNPAEEILQAVRPAMASIPNALLMGISTPYSRTGPLYEVFREKYGQDDKDVLVWRAASRQMNPSIPAAVVDKALAADYAAARAEYLAEWRDDVTSFLTADLIEEAIKTGRTQLPRVYHVEYKAFVDPSGGTGSDSFSMAIAHKTPGGVIVLDYLDEVRPPLSPKTVVYKFSKMLEYYGIDRVEGDAYSGAWVREAFRERNIEYWPSRFNKSEIYLNFEPLAAQGQIELLDNARLKEQLRGLERRTRSGGKDGVDHGPGLHDDLANAAAGAIVAAVKRGSTWTAL